MICTMMLWVGLWLGNVVRPMQKTNRKIWYSTTCKIVTPENIIVKICIRDYVCMITRHAIFCFNRYSGASQPNRRKATTLWLFDCPVLSCRYLFSRSCAQVERLDRFLRFMAHTTCFHARMFILGVKAMGDHIWGKYAPETPQNGREQATSSQNGKM